MRKVMLKVTALAMAGAMCFSLASCSLFGTGRRDRNDGDGPKWFQTEPASEPSSDASEPDVTPAPAAVDPDGYIATSDELTYPDHVPTYEEIHPVRSEGTVKGEEAAQIISDCELALIQDGINSYAWAKIYFEDPEAYGIDLSDVSWGPGNCDIESSEEDEQFYDDILEQLYSIDSTSLSEDDLLCYEKMVYDCELNKYCCSYTAFNYYTMAFNFLVGPQSDIMFVLDLYTFDTVEDAENYILLVKDIDRYFGEMCDFEDQRVAYGFISSDYSYEESAKSFDNLVAMEDDCFLYESFEERLDNIKGLSDADRQRLIDENLSAMHDDLFPGFRDCAERMRSHKGAGGGDYGLCKYRGGDAYYSVLCMIQSNSSMSVDDSMKMCSEYMDGLNNEFWTIINSSDRSWVSEYMNHDYSRGSVQDTLTYLNDAIEGEFPEIPSHGYYLMDVPECFEESFSPAAYIGYHLDKDDSNLIIVNNGSSDGSIGVTLAHEGYPGHMYQSLYTRNATSHPYMYIFDSIGYNEGWAEYVEMYAFRYFTDTESNPGARLVCLENELNVVMGTMMDYGIHVDGWTIDDCIDYLNEVYGGGIDESAVKEIYTLIVTDPSYYVKYGMGYIHTVKIMEEARQEFPDATEEEIHKAYLDCLTMNYETIETDMKQNLTH